MAESNHARVTPANDEIDLLDLISTLWQRKFLIVLIAALGFAGAYGASLLMKEEWRSTAMVVGPRVANTGEILDVNRTLARVMSGENLIDPLVTRKFVDIEVDEILTKIFETFLYTAADSDEKQEYLAKTGLFKRLLSEGDTSEAALLNDMSQNLMVEIPDEKKKSLTMAYSLSFTSDSAESAQETLSGYMDSIDKASRDKVIEEFNNTLNAQISLRTQQVADIEHEVKYKRKVAIDNYKEALLTAKKAGIKSSPGSLAGRGDSMSNLVLEINSNPQQLLYLQGEEVLQALVDVSESEPLIYPEIYYRLKYEVESLEKLKDANPEFQTFNYQMRPTLPTKRIAPKRAQLAVLGGVLGGVLASLYVLIAGAFANRRRAAATGNA